MNPLNLIKTIVLWAVILGFLAFAGWQTYLFVVEQSIPRTTVTLRGTTYNAKVSIDEKAREKGLSGTDSLAKTDAMLFVFPNEDTWGIWMKDMKYPIDIIWLDEDRRIIYIVKSADPSSYPYTTFKPKLPARYVIELQSGTVNSRLMKIGDKAQFDLSSIEEVAE